VVYYGSHHQNIVLHHSEYGMPRYVLCKSGSYLLHATCAHAYAHMYVHTHKIKKNKANFNHIGPVYIAV